MRYWVKLLALALLLVGCSGTSTSVSPVYDDAELLKEKDLSLSHLNEIGELRELLAAEKDLSQGYLNEIGNLERKKRSDFPRTLITSYGPCGYFILDGQRILKLEYDSSLGPWNEDSKDVVSDMFRDSIRWADTGASLADHDWDPDRSPFRSRPPNYAAAVNIDSALNPFFWVNYQDTGRFIEDEGNAESNYWTNLRWWEGITGANTMNYSGFFGPDKDCNWDWVYVESSLDIDGNDTVPGTGGGSSLEINAYMKVNKDGEWVFEWKDYTCPFETRYATAVYNPDLHLFVSDCGIDRS
jgi:hypothetical protein